MMSSLRPATSKSSARAAGLASALLALVVSACSQAKPAEAPPAEEPRGRVAGGPCDYVDVAGTCTVRTVEDASANDFRCEGGPQSKKVTFEFVPTDASAKLEYGGADPARDVLTAGGGQLPSAGWLQANSVAEGASFGCTRKHITGGTCSPVVWEFPTLKLDDQPCR